MSLNFNKFVFVKITKLNTGHRNIVSGRKRHNIAGGFSFSVIPSKNKSSL